MAGSGETSSIGRRRTQARHDPGSGYVERRDGLLKAAAAVFRAKGFQAASMNDIALAVGQDRASVYYYYGSKQELFLDVIRQAVEEIVRLAEEIVASPDSSTDKLQRIFGLVLEGYETHYPYLFIYIQEDMRRVASDRSGPGMILFRLGERYEKALDDLTREGVERGEFRDDIDSRVLSMAIMGAVNWSHRWFKPGGRFTGAEIGQMYAEIFLNGVSTRPKPRPKRQSAAETRAAPGKRRT